MDLSYITNQVHPTYNSKCKTWKLIADSYSGGTTYRDGNYLHKYTSREPDISYTERKKRSIYLNNVQPLADMFIGFLYNSEPIRSGIKSEYILENATPTKSFDEFMIQVATNSILYTCGVLVDSPSFDPSLYPTEASRKQAGLNPYCVLYHPWQIRNYNVDRQGRLNWILLDDSYYSNNDPFSQAEYKICYRLWTREYIQDLTSTIGLTSNTSINQIIATNTMGDFKEGPQIPLPATMTEIPFHFVNFKDKNACYISDTIFEDVCLIDQSIYNYMSLMDEMIHGGTFKIHFFPGEIPPELKSQGLSNYAVVSYPQDGNKPFFDGPALGDIDPFLQSINFLIVGIQRALGLNTDQEKQYAQSGEAKKFDFTKTKALLMSGAEALEKCEKQIFKFAGMWEGTDDSQAEIEYKKDFMGSEQQQELARLYEMILNIGDYSSVKSYASKRIAEINFSEILTSEELKEIDTDIEDKEAQREELSAAGQANMAAMVGAEINQKETGDGKGNYQMQMGSGSNGNGKRVGAVG